MSAGTPGRAPAGAGGAGPKPAGRAGPWVTQGLRRRGRLGTQWHLAGRDCPFTAPHLLLPAGIAGSGLCALGGVLWYSLTSRGPAPGRGEAGQQTRAAACGGGGGGGAWSRRGGGGSGEGGGPQRGGVLPGPRGRTPAGYGAPLRQRWPSPWTTPGTACTGVDVTIWAPFHVMIWRGWPWPAWHGLYPGGRGRGRVARWDWRRSPPCCWCFWRRPSTRRGLAAAAPAAGGALPAPPGGPDPPLAGGGRPSSPWAPRPASRPPSPRYFPRHRLHPAGRLPRGGATPRAFPSPYPCCAWPRSSFVPWAARVTAQGPRGCPSVPGRRPSSPPPGLSCLGAARRGPDRRRAVALPLPALVAPGAARAAADGDGGRGAAGPARTAPGR